MVNILYHSDTEVYQIYHFGRIFHFSRDTVDSERHFAKVPANLGGDVGRCTNMEGRMVQTVRQRALALLTIAILVVAAAIAAIPAGNALGITLSSYWVNGNGHGSLTFQARTRLDLASTQVLGIRP
jgi:hypothetical protein